MGRLHETPNYIPNSGVDNEGEACMKRAVQVKPSIHGGFNAEEIYGALLLLSIEDPDDLQRLFFPFFHSDLVWRCWPNTSQPLCRNKYVFDFHSPWRGREGAANHTI